MTNDPHTIKHSRPIHGDAFNYNSTIADRHGSTSGTLSRYGPSIVSATATGLNYTLPAPQTGLVKHLAVSYTGATGALTIRAASTSQFFGGSTYNTISVASGEPLAMLTLLGTTGARWAVQWSCTPTTGTPSVSFAGATY